MEYLRSNNYCAMSMDLISIELPQLYIVTGSSTYLPKRFNLTFGEGIFHF